MIKKMIRFVKKKIGCRINPVKYYRSIGVKIGEGTRIYTSETDIFSSEPWVVSIGKNCHITAGCKFLTHDGGTLILDKNEGGGHVLVGDIVVGDNVYIGLRSIIMPGITIGNNVIIGAGSIVTKNIPDNSVVAGVPARVISTKEDYSNKVLRVINGEDDRYYQDLEYMHSKNPKRKKSK